MKLKRAEKPTHSLMDAIMTLTGNELKTYLYIKETGNGGVVEVPMRSLAAKSGVCNVTIRKSLKSLAEKGWIEIVRQSCRNTGKDTGGKTTMLVKVI